MGNEREATEGRLMDITTNAAASQSSVFFTMKLLIEVVFAS